MPNIKTIQAGKQIDQGLQAFLNVMKLAATGRYEDNVMYIRHGKDALESGLALFDITELTQG